MSETTTRRLLIAVTGASGMIYLRSFLEQCQALRQLEIHGICSEAGAKVLQLESGSTPGQLPAVRRWFEPDDFTAAPASGSSGYEAMLVLPCSMGTLGAIAGGLSINLIHRSADVVLKERRRLVLGVRETPFNRTHLLNMLAAHDSGAVICPIMPAMYFQPKTLEEAALFFAWRVMDLLELEVPDRKRWGEHD